MNIAQIFVIVPLTYADLENLQEYQQTFFYNFIMEADSVGYNCSIMLILSFTIDRFIIFLNIFLIKKMKIRIVFFCIFSWIYGLIIMILNNTFEIRKEYDRENFCIIVNINNSSLYSVFFISYTQMFSRIVPFIILGLYAFCIIRVKQFVKNNAMTFESRRFERKLLIQGFTFALFYEIEALLFYQRDFILSIIGKQFIKYYFVILNFFIIVFTCFNSVAMYIFIDKAKEDLKNYFICKR
ncbi:G protein-coupled receptor, rhodopsin-like family and GPCR, rhodopsin-like, 7TM domain-containing protein [Strongyloides ratti]|uniref:G protein-coupled receptor, rhodopsin-like family and GPCR, rhodopsin-like, 7TM domain-containing protein n=1 Tax=Strongyloides ratti TaxID=34506 RepID=A0A090LKB9_STRRB|nr:G protein-coupled receptor, rhodopsin-like family and GPCR, rhodopsin-like, 7TM domain-containing protein [Strongyloides ratti]CEF70153.1 G protein-coupled receptor, rhodopsin-like family and GPCR, rhodopsin-like, 7TM domain-containing protein [Strongyloides ratti]